MPRHVRLHPVEDCVPEDGDTQMHRRLARERAMASLASLWGALRWYWALAILGLLAIGAISAYARGGTHILRDPRTWPIWQVVRSYPFPPAVVVGVAIAVTWYVVVAAIYWELQRRRRLAAQYGLRRVRRVRPEEFVPFYVPTVFLARVEHASQKDAHVIAEQALRIAATRGKQSVESPLGICIYGRAAQGKTRLAWEALRVALPGWTLLKWPQEPRLPLDLSILRGQHVVLWLDDAHEYATPTTAATLCDLPQRFAAVGIPLVIVATCRNSQGIARARLAGLLERLTSIHLEDITAEHATQLVAALGKAGVDALLEEFDGTPGSLLLRIRQMRRLQYPGLNEDAQRILHALRLLRSAHIYSYPVWRVRPLAMRLFSLAPTHWENACAKLIEAGFVSLQPLPGDSNNRTLKPVCTAYLDQSVPDYLSPNADSSDDWPALFEVLERQKDHYALVALGNAFTDLVKGVGPFLSYNPRIDKEMAVLSLRTALEVCSQETMPIAWAMTQLDLGRTLANRANVTEGILRADFRRQALAAYCVATTILTERVAPAHWALAQLQTAHISQQRGADAFYMGDVETASMHFLDSRFAVLAALSFYTVENDPARHREATKLRNDIERALDDLGLAIT